MPFLSAWLLPNKIYFVFPIKISLFNILSNPFPLQFVSVLVSYQSQAETNFFSSQVSSFGNDEESIKFLSQTFISWYRKKQKEDYYNSVPHYH